jgi:hypothetical protein
MTSKRLCLVEMLALVAVLAASQAVAQSIKEQTHHQHASGEQMPSADEAQLPPLKILMPENGATVGTQLALVFQTPADLSTMAMGAPGTHHKRPKKGI